MIWDLLEWLQLANQSVLQAVAVAKKPNDLIFILYLLSFKKSWHFAMAFLFCVLLTDTNFFGLLNNLEYREYGTLFYLAISLTWSLAVSSQIKPKMNKSLAFWCSIMMLFLLLMAWDSWHNYDTETYIYSNYESIIVCIHAGIILSLYRPSAIINLLVDNIRRHCDRILRSYSVQFICYTVSQYKQVLAKKWVAMTIL